MSDLLRRLEVRLADVEALVARLSAEVGDLAAVLTGGDADGADRAVGPVPEPAYASVHAWVEVYFDAVFVRTVGGEFRWCGRWVEHPEAILRLEAMWRAWEVLRLDGGLGLSTWLLHHLDPGLAALSSRSGPFARCTPDRHN